MKQNNMDESYKQEGEDGKEYGVVHLLIFFFLFLYYILLLFGELFLRINLKFVSIKV